MILFEDIKKVYDSTSLDVLVNNYEKRQRDAEKQDNEQFCVFLADLNKELDNPTLIPFYRNLFSEITKNIRKGSYNEELMRCFAILSEVSKPKTTDFEALTSLNWQIKQAMNPSYNELSYAEKIGIIFHIIFGKFDLEVQKQFLKLLKKYNFNYSMDLLELMTFAINYYNGKTSLEELEQSLETLITVQKIEKSATGFIADTSYGSIPLSYASDCLGVSDTSLLTLGNCHLAVSEYLKSFPNLYGAYYYVPNYFKGFIEHSVLIDYDKKIVYDLSHNIALPLEYFSKYYNNLSFIISSADFVRLSDMVKQHYGYTLSMYHIEEVKRQLKK